jgi:hypothetical protein
MSANDGYYSVIVTNSYGAITSSMATLTVTFPPSFIAQPTNLSVVAGSNALFSASVNGALPLVYKWQQNGTNLVNGGNLSGATTNALALTAVTATNAGNYTLVVTNIYGAATSSVATLTVLLPAAITVPPAAQTIQCSSNASFSVTATGTAPLKYQWSFDGVAITAAINTSLTLTNVHLPSHTVVVVVTNLYGSATSSVLLTVQDTLAPVISLNSTNPFYVELGGTYPEPGATAYDLCAGVVPVATNGLVNTSAVSTNTVTYTVTDGNGNTNTATRTVIVQDSTPPTILWSFTNLVLTANSNCVAAMPNVTGTNCIIATDASGTLTITQNPTNNAVLLLGTNVVVITVADTSGNKSYSTNRIAVRDVTPPVITLNGFNPMTNQLGTALTDPGVTASDTCSGIALLITNGAVNVNEVGTNTLTYTAVDGSGNTNTATRTVVVIDTTPPTILWSFTNLVLVANSNCVAAMPDVTGTNFILATDLSGAVTITQSPANNAVLQLGTNAVVLTAADASGNKLYSTNHVTVTDQTPPVVTLIGSSLMTNELGSVFTDPGVVASDSCSGIAFLTTNGTVNIGTNLLTYTAVDGSGNTNTATRTVVVIDTTPPTIVWSFTNLVLAADTNCSAAMPDVTGTNFILAGDLSGALAIFQSPTNLAPLLLGTNLVVITVKDAATNAAYSTNIIIVRDQTPPVITLNGSNPVFAELGVTFTDAGATANDSCAGSVPVATSGTVNPSIIGTNTLTYTADDGGGNTNTATRTVIVRDTTPPTIVWSFTNLVLAADTNCSAAMSDVTGTNFILASDLSGALAISQIPTNGAVLLMGTNVIVVVASDIFSNTAYSTNTIVVQDQTPPLIVGQPQSQTNLVGTTASFSVAATACTPLAYQWFFTNAIVSGQTNSTLTLASVSPALAGDYSVVASASGGSATSLVATLTVDLIPPGINGVAANFDGSFTLDLLGSPGCTYVLEATTNLFSAGNWLPVATNTVGTNGVWQFTDASATNFPQQFYRLKFAP